MCLASPCCCKLVWKLDQTLRSGLVIEKRNFNLWMWSRCGFVGSGRNRWSWCISSEEEVILKTTLKWVLWSHFHKLQVTNAPCVNLSRDCFGKFVLEDAPMKHINSVFCNQENNTRSRQLHWWASCFDREKMWHHLQGTSGTCEAAEKSRPWVDKM